MSQHSRHVADFRLSGMRYWDGAEVLGKIKLGDKLKMRYEKDNAYDPNAVAVYYKDTKLGYIPRGENAFLAQLLRCGHKGIIECRVLKVDKKAEPWDQLYVGLYMTKKK